MKFSKSTLLAALCLLPLFALGKIEDCSSHTLICSNGHVTTQGLTQATAWFFAAPTNPVSCAEPQGTVIGNYYTAQVHNNVALCSWAYAGRLLTERSPMNVRVNAVSGFSRINGNCQSTANIHDCSWNNNQ